MRKPKSQRLHPTQIPDLGDDHGVVESRSGGWPDELVGGGDVVFEILMGGWKNGLIHRASDMCGREFSPVAPAHRSVMDGDGGNRLPVEGNDSQLERLPLLRGELEIGGRVGGNDVFLRPADGREQQQADEEISSHGVPVSFSGK